MANLLSASNYLDFMSDKKQPPLVVGNDLEPPLSLERKWDQKVYGFIESKKPLTLYGLLKFLRDNTLPIKESWIYYCIGKTNAQSSSRKEDVIESLLQGECVSEYLPELYYWNNFRYNISAPDSKSLVINDYNSEAFIIECWKYVDEQIKNDEEIRLYKASIEVYANAAEYYDPYSVKTCGACGESPCMCSDPERTSTTYEG